MRSKIKTIVSSGLVAGTLDITAAILIYSVILHKTTAEKILRSIASGIFKNEAYTNGIEMTILGLGLHFLIALLFAWFYFKIFPYLPFFKINTFLSGISYGFFIWAVMNLIVLPIVFPVLPEKNLDTALLLSILIVICCVGLPIAFITKKYYAKWY
nr:DUF1440 domain-containing protein [uncultured Flavobacterium sp.]